MFPLMTLELPIMEFESQRINGALCWSLTVKKGKIRKTVYFCKQTIALRTFLGLV